MENQNNSYTNPEGEKTVLEGLQFQVSKYVIKLLYKAYITRKKIYSSMEQNRRIKHKYT